MYTANRTISIKVIPPISIKAFIELLEEDHPKTANVNVQAAISDDELDVVVDLDALNWDIYKGASCQYKVDGNERHLFIQEAKIRIPNGTQTTVYRLFEAKTLITTAVSYNTINQALSKMNDWICDEADEF